MNIYQYIDEYGIYSFEEKSLNEVDAMIFAFLSYVDYSKIMEEKKRLSIQEAGRMHLGLYSNKDRNIIAVKEANKLLRYLKDTKRYKDCILSHYEYVGNEKVQFGAICIEYQKGKVYVSFEGTDSLFSGWKENFLLSSNFPTLSHKMAIYYLNKHFTFSRKQLIIGGHSKGGNLALVAGMYANILVRSRIQKVYSGDGPGLLREEYESIRYKNIKKKYIHIIPEYSIVGILLNHSNDNVVASSKKGLLAHNLVYWTVEKNHFKKGTLNTLSKEIDKRIIEWVENTSNEDKIDAIEAFYKILEEANIHSINELKDNKRKIIDIISKSNEISKKSKDKVMELVKILLKSIETTQKEEFKSLITNFLKIKE